MASSSASSINNSFKYDVFLSFRGEDTRKNFVDHLYYGLQQKSIHTYKDDEKIEKGKRISDELIRSIEDSKFYIIVFSKNYASSSWCLDELVKIMECQKTTEQTAYPVFYDVEPTEIRKQSGSVGEAFAKFEKEETAGKWREAMKEAADLAGWELKNTADGHEAKFIQKIVEVISLELRFIDSSIDGKLIGMETRVKDVVSSLETGIDDVRMIGIKGMGGAGKTTLARAIYDQISVRFEGKSFVENVREVSKASLYGLTKLQEQLLSDVSNDRTNNVTNVYDGKNMMKKMMRCRKVLVVLDDVDNIDQLEALAGEPNWFKPGSRIIITTRDEQVLVAHRVNFIQDVNLLSYEEAICLFSRYAFGKEIPIHGYKKLSKQVVHYAAGLPLTIRVLGSFLCGKDDLEWIDALERLKNIPLKETLEKIELSYTCLEDDYKEIFLDVACILKGWKKDKAIRVLESCGFHARNGLRVLEQKSLITISDFGNLGMHDHIEEMGRNIVRRLHPDEPHKHSHLWIDEEIEDMLANDRGTKATRCIFMSAIKKHEVMRGLEKMKKLRVLLINYGHDRNFDAAGKCFPNTLRYISYWNYPFESLVEAFQEDNLVGLNIVFAHELRKVGETKVLNYLKFLDLEHSKLRKFDLGLTPNLETLVLEDCVDFVELHMPNRCVKLKSLNLINTKVRTLDLGLTPNLETLSLERCNYLVELDLSFGCPKLKSLNVSGSLSCLRRVNLGPMPNLEMLTLQGRQAFFELHMPFPCPKLKSLSLSMMKLKTLDLALTLNLKSLYINNSKLGNLILGPTPDLETLDLTGCDLVEVELHIPFQCPKLKSLNLISIKVRTLDFGLTPNLETLTLEGCYYLEELDMSFRCPKLNSLSVSDSQSCLRRVNLGPTPNLEMLTLKGCEAFVELHMPFPCPKLKSLSLSMMKLKTLDLALTLNLKSLYINHSKLGNLILGPTPDLETLDLTRCDSVEVELHMPFRCPKLKSLCLSKSKLRALDIGLTPNLERLDLKECYSLVELRAPIGCLKRLVYLDLSGCGRFKSFLFDKRFKSLKVGSLSELDLFAESIDTCPLQCENNLPKFRLSCYYEEHPASTFGNLEKLISIGLCACTNLERFSASIFGLRCLTKLTVEANIPELPEDLHHLECLEALSLSYARIKHLPDNICKLKHLKFLQLESCWLIESLPEDLARLECLEELDLTECVSLRHVPKSICEMKRLQYFHLPYCILVEKFPEEFGDLECLKELNIECTGISRLPQSIFRLKGVRIVGSRWRLESYGFTSLSMFEDSKYTVYCYI